MTPAPDRPAPDAPGLPARRKKPDPDGAAYRRAEIRLALSYCPTISPCPTCRWPVIDGFRCETCDPIEPCPT